jgi:glycosyltransferase involved in cell wall biosynthesis
MRIGIVVKDTWAFFHEIYADLAEHHQAALFEPRTVSLPLCQNQVNRRLFQRDLKRFMHANNVVFFEWASELLVTASRLPKTCGIVTRLHRYEMYQWAEEINWDVVDRIIVVSKAKQHQFSSRFPEQASKVVVIPEAVSLAKFQPQAKPFNGDIGILCYLRPRKRVYELILAFHELNQRRDGLHLHIGGGSRPRFLDYAEAVHNLVRQLDLQDKVTFYGHVTDPQEWYHNIDLFVSNSYSEGLQVSPLEAMASGCYCLSHRWDGADELLPDSNLFYTSSELGDKILEYCDLPEGEKQRRRAILRHRVMEKFDVAQVKVRIRQVIEDVGALAGMGSRSRP